MKSGRRLLFLLPFAPRLDASHGGGRVMGQFLAEMAERHTVAILYLRSSDEPALDEFFREHCERTEEVVRPTLRKTIGQRARRLGQITGALLRQEPIWVSDWASPNYARRCREMAREFRPELIQAEFHVMAQYVAALDGYRAPRVLVEHEAGIRAAPYLRVRPALVRRAVAALDRRAWMRYEREIMRQFQAVVAFTEADRSALLPLAGGTPLYRISPGTVLPVKPLNSTGQFPPVLLFIGSFHHPANVEAALRLVKSIYPLVRRQFPDVRLSIVGEAPPPEIWQESRPDIEVTGRVPDITPYLDCAAVFVAPVRSGGGMRVKILEALAAGKAVVATPLAAEGLALENGREILLAEGDSELATRIGELLADPEKRSALGTSARTWACDHLQWEPAIRAFEAVYSDLLRE